MANTVQDNNRVAWTYTRNNGTTDYRVSAKKVYVTHVTDGAKYGGAAAASTVPRLPRGFRMRAVRCTDPSGGLHWLTCYEPNATLVTAGTTVTRDLNGVDATFTSTGDIREERSPGGGITQST